MYPNGQQSTFNYDPENRLTSMTAGQAGYMYNLGPTGIRTGATEVTGRTLTWNFDGIYRLTGETVAGDAQYNGSVNYGLDPVGNRLSQSSTLHGISSLGFSYNADDQILGETYDANGNTTATGGKTFGYDSENHLVSMNGGAVTMIYDGDSNRVVKTANGSTTRYLIDDLNPTGYAQVVEETVNGAAQREYTYGLQRIDEDQIVNNAWTPSFYGYDGFGTVRQLTSLTGAVTDTYEYDAYGNEITSTGTTPNNYLYRGEQWDSDLNLYYMRARYYNPQTGRFMSRDPYNGKFRIPTTLHKYLYAAGDPVTFVDPNGREEIEYSVLLSRAEVAKQYIGAIGCGVSIGFGAATLVLDHEGFVDTLNHDPIGPIAGVIGCIGVIAGPTGAASLALDTVGGIACIDGARLTVDDYNEYLAALSASNDTAADIYEFRFINDLTQGVLGCALTGFSSTVDIGGYFD